MSETPIPTTDLIHWLRDTSPGQVWRHGPYVVAAAEAGFISLTGDASYPMLTFTEAGLAARGKK